MNQKVLESIGLTRGEADVYLTLLKAGNTTSGLLIKESGVSRSKVYDVLERLKQKGFVSEVIKENTRYFEATDPSRIIDYLNSKKAELDKSIISSQQLVKELKKTQSTHLEKQEAKIYIGIEGLKTVYNEILQELGPKDEYLAFGIGPEEIKDEEISLFIRKFHMKRGENKIQARIIMNNATKSAMKFFSDLKHYSYRFTDVQFPTNIAIYKDKVLTLVWGDKPLVFVIESEQVARKYRDYFEYVWGRAKR